ncbi:GNAT family N-acetyltransferase [uncultured Jannaschia sp.]|uniref:GNAT family N-acetyltransferase n=1 Tax=uncultured Jannaschia sp. TaxID=293347 RepID=UPI0026106DDC|nr:GNAT family N-acetyltransferase [uncultured Jannaschia sp.]
MKIDQMAALHAACFHGPARWSDAAFAAAVSDPLCFVLAERETGFLLGRTVADEAELLTLAVDPDHRRAGLGQSLLARFEDTARTRGADAAFLEVAADNAPARALYDGAGWQLAGQRTGYYGGVDALTLRKTL